jgi:small subunit ribosomal protein S6
LKKYEAVFILDIRRVDDEGQAFSQELTELMKGWNGSITESVSLGRRQFAREIKKRKAGIYWKYTFESNPEVIEQIRDKFRLDERVLREMIIAYDRPEKLIEPKMAAPARDNRDRDRDRD